MTSTFIPFPSLVDQASLSTSSDASGSSSVTGLSFLSAPSANALISELRPTTLSPPALAHVNALIDEILSLLISNAESINPSHIRTQGIPAVFTGDKTAGETTGPKALGRSAVAEAEIELRSWYEINPGARRAAFGQDGSGTGVKGGREFPVKEAIDLLKLKCVQYSVSWCFGTLAGLQLMVDTITYRTLV